MNDRSRLLSNPVGDGSATRPMNRYEGREIWKISSGKLPCQMIKCQYVAFQFGEHNFGAFLFCNCTQHEVDNCFNI